MVGGGGGGHVLEASRRSHVFQWDRKEEEEDR